MRKRVLLASSWTNSIKVLGYYLSPPMGLYRIQHWLEKKHDVDILDPNVEDPINFLENCGFYDVIGFSPTKDNLHNDIALIHYARKLYPQTQIVLGGSEASNNYQMFLNMDIVDFIIMGEGEKALEFFLENKFNIHISPGIMFKNKSTSTFLSTDELTWVTSLDFGRLPLKEYWKRNASVTNNDPLSTNCINLYITNNCPIGCKFCSTTRPDVKVVGINPHGLVRMLEKIMIQVPDTKTIYFHDDNACGDRKNTIEWCTEAIRAGINVSYVASSRIRHFDSEMLDIMIKAGFRKLSCGIEAYSDSLLKKVRKAQRVKDIDNFISLMRDAGIPVHVNVILCQPEAEIDDVKRTAEFCLRILEDKRNTVGVEPYIKAYTGSWYYDNWDLIEYTYNTVPSINGTKSEKIRIPGRFLPRDKKVHHLLVQIDEAYKTDGFFIDKRKESYLTAQLSEKLCKLALELIKGL